MRSGRRAAIMATLLASVLWSCGSDKDAARKPAVRFIASPMVEVHPGSETELALQFEIADEHHIQANPAARDNLIAAQVELSGSSVVEFGTPVYPPGHTFVLEGSDWNLSTYEGRITIGVPVRVQPSATPGAHEFQGTFSFQACNRRSCLRPTSVPIAVALQVSGASNQ